MKSIKKLRLGVTLIELIISIAIIGMIVVSFMPLFTMSARTNSKSENTLDSTYIGRDTMELIYSLSKKIPYDELESELINDYNYIKISENIYEYEYEDNKYEIVEFKENGNLIRVLVQVYKDEDMNENELEVQYESYYPWMEVEVK